MAIVQDKERVFGQIAAIKSIVDNSKKKLNNGQRLYPSINNSQDSISFLIDIVNDLIGADELKYAIIELLTQKLDIVEIKIKDEIKASLKGLLNCGVNPSIPDFLKNTGAGVELEINKFDYYDLLKVNPTALYADMLYEDIASELDSTDFNTHLFYSIQYGGEQPWGTQGGLVNDVITTQYNQIGTIANNTITVKASPHYSNYKTLTDLNNDYVDSIKIFPTSQLFNNTIDMAFGGVSNAFNKTSRTLQKQEELNAIVDNILNSDELIIDDSYFEFTNPQIVDIEYKSTQRSKGIRELVTCDTFESEININTLSGISYSLQSTSNLVEQKTIIETGLNTLAEEASNNASPEDKTNIKLNMFIELIRGIAKAMVNAIMSPKLILIFIVNNEIVYGTSSFDTPTILMKQMKNLFKNVIDTIKDAICDELMKISLKEVSKLSKSIVTELATEQITNQRSQVISLLGGSEETIRMIKGIV